MFDLYCPACGKKMNDVVFTDGNFEYPEKQCPKCLTIYEVLPISKEEKMSPKEVVLVPRTKDWLKKNGQEHLNGVLPDSW